MESHERFLAAMLALAGLGIGFATSRPAHADPIPQATEPLTPRDFGLYGGWNSYFLQKGNGFDFLILQARVPKNFDAPDEDISSHGQPKSEHWNDQLRKARAAGKRVIADLNLRFKDKEVSVEQLKRQLDYFMSHVDVDQLYAVTLSEENIYWDGNLDKIKVIYKYAKSKYKGVAFYQWYSPAAGTPGFGWPALPADGWMLDEYARVMPDYERFIREYMLTRLPIISIIWASPSMRSFKWQGQGDVALEQQWDIHNKYGIPSSFFTWSGKGNIWGWSEDTPKIDGQVFEQIRQRMAREVKGPAVVDKSSWDQPVPVEIPLTSALENTASFKEDYAARGGQLVRAAGITGFRHLRYLGQGLEFAPDTAGAAESSVIYRLRYPFAPVSASVKIEAKYASGADVSITLSCSADGKMWSKPVALNHGVAVMNLSGEDPLIKGQSLWVRVEMKGHSTQANEALAVLNSLVVREHFESRSPAAIDLKPGDDGAVSYDADFQSLSILHTARLENPQVLVTSPGSLVVVGRKGVTNQAEIVQQFHIPVPMDMRSLSVRVQANEPDLGSVARVGVSRDGKTPASMASTSGRVNGWFSVPEADLKTLGKVTNFYIHVELLNRSGTPKETPRLMGLKFEMRS